MSLSHINNKSNLSRAAAIEYVVETKGCKDDTTEVGNRSAISYFYFKYDDIEHQSVDLVARRILKQLVWQHGSIHPTLYRIYQNHKCDLPCKLSTFVDLIHSYCNDFASIYVFLDGLDECTSDQQSTIIDFIIQLRRSAKVRLFLTAQPHLNTLVARVGIFSYCQIVAQSEDLRTYVLQALQRGGVDDTALKEILMKDLIVEAQGM